MWLFAKQITEYSVVKVLLWVAIIGTILSLPSIGLDYGLHHWTEQNFGFGARTIALVDTAAASPFGELEHYPAADVDRILRAGRPSRDLVRADGVVDESGAGCGQLQTKYLNQIFPVLRGDYAELGGLLITRDGCLGLVVPHSTAILLFGRRVCTFLVTIPASASISATSDFWPRDRRKLLEDRAVYPLAPSVSITWPASDVLSD